MSGEMNSSTSSTTAVQTIIKDGKEYQCRVEYLAYTIHNGMKCVRCGRQGLFKRLISTTDKNGFYRMLISHPTFTISWRDVSTNKIIRRKILQTSCELGRGMNLNTAIATAKVKPTAKSSS